MAPPLPDDTSTIVPEPTAQSVTAMISVAGTDATATTVSASGLVLGVIESGGTCTFTFSNGSDESVLDREGIENVSSTSCGLVSLPLSDLTGTGWTVTLSYSSATVSSAVSEPMPVEMP